MASKAMKKKESKERVASAVRTMPEQSMAPSVVGSLNEKDEKAKKAKQPIVIWPEWSEQDIAQEKWETAHKAKEKEKGKSPNPHPYEDPEGRIDLPASIKGQVDHWKRPVEFMVEKVPVVVDPKSLTEGIDLLSANDHLTHSELLRWIIGQVTCLWKQHFKVEPVEVKNAKDVKESNKGDKEKDKDKDKDKEKDKDALAEDNTWKPWGHIWPKEKTKGSSLPVYNPGGKYCVRIFWMGTWRKVTIDDWMPFDEEGKLLLPATPNEYELWPMLLSKALIKVASLDYAGGYSASEFGDFTVVHALTGWLPEIIPLRCGQIGEIWKLLLQALPHWKLENTPPPEEKKSPNTESKKKDDKDKERKSTKSDKALGQDRAERDNKAKDKDKAGDKVLPVTNPVEITKEPEFVIFASYCHPPNTPMRHSVLKEMADASEKLRQSGLSHIHPHPVMLTTVRDCPLVPPPPPVQIPRWKLIRQKKKKQPVEPALTPPAPPKDPQFLEVVSPFLNHKVSPIPVSRARTPVRWLKFRPEKPMGEILEEGDKDDGEKKEGGEGEEGADKPATAEKKEGASEDPAAVKEDDKSKTSLQRLEGEEPKAEHDKERDSLKESKDSRESLPTRSSTKESLKTGTKEREKSAKSDKAEKDKLPKSADKTDKPRSGSKLSVVDKVDRTKSGGASPKGRRMSRIERGGDLMTKTPPESRRMSRVDKVAVKVESERESSHKVDTIREDEIPVLDLPSAVADGEKSPGDGTDGEANEEKTEGDKAEESEKEETNKEKKIWMEYDDFCKCFRHLYIFHKPNTYSYSKGNAELKNVAMTSHVGKKSGLIPASSVTATTPAPGKATALSPSPYGGYGGPSQIQDPPPPFLFVDSLKPIEIVVNFTAFSRWLDAPQPIVREKDKEKEKDSNSVITDPKDAIQVEEKPVPPTAGRLVAEPYSWKSLVTGQPILRICTTGTRASVLILPSGRHVLRFLVQAPHGYHVEMASQTPFVYGDEDTVMACLTKESCRFLEHALGVIQSVGNLVASFADPPADRKFDLDLGLKDQPKDIQDRHYKVFIKCLLKTVRFHLVDSYDLAMHFAWKAFQFQASLCLHQRVGHRPLSAAEITRIGSMKNKRRHKSASAVPPTWVDRTSNNEEETAAARIQATYRGYFLRKLARAYMKGTDEHQKVSELLSKAWSVIESANLESCAIQIFRLMFKRDPGLFPLFPFYKDEWSRVAYTDYNGGFPEQPPNSWFVVFREVFYVDEPVLMVPKLYVNLPTCLLRVVDNSTGEELTRVFQKVAPNNLKKNKRGYTFVAEARTPNAILPPGKFRLRVIGSTEPLPYPGRDSVNSHFINKELRDYYIPNKYNIIFRYTVKVTEDHMVSLQLGTSKADVYVKLQILDHEQEVSSTTGKAHAVIPAFTFLRDRTGDEEEKQGKRGSRPPTSSRPRSAKRPPSGSRKAAASPVQSKGSKKSGKESNTSRPGSSKGSRPLLYDDSTDKEDEEPEDTEPEIKIHKYIIQAQVLRDSWPLSKSAWDFVAMLKSLDRVDVEVPAESAPRGDKLSASVTKGKKSKEGKEGRGSKAQTNSRPSSQQQFDSSKPNWTLRIVSDANVEEIEVKKDTERQDEIKAMKQAWEAAEPGRAAKAQQSRQKFLNEHMVKIEKDANEEENGDEEQNEEKDVSSSEIFTVTSPVQSETDQGELTLVPPPKEPDQILQPLSPPKIIRSRGGVPILLDEEEKERRLQERAARARAFKTQREEVVEKRREQDRLDRNAAKERQLQEAEELQAALDKARSEVNQKREAYRQKFLEAEKQKEEALAAEAAKERERSPSPSKSRKSASTTKGGRKTPSKGKKK